MWCSAMLLPAVFSMINTPFPAARLQSVEVALNQLNATDSIIVSRMTAMQAQVLATTHSLVMRRLWF